MSHNVYLVGSVPMANAEQVFRTVSAAFGAKLKRIPDGETGERSDWITWLRPVFSENPAFELSGEIFRLHETAPPIRRYTLRPGYSVKDVRIDNLFYADIAAALLSDLQGAQGCREIPAGTRFQVDLVPAHSVIWLFLVDELHAPIDPIYNEALKHEIDKIAAAIPHRNWRSSSTWRRRCSRACSASRSAATAARKAEMQETFQQYPDRSRQSGAGRHRAPVPSVLRRFQSSPRGRADRHGRHGGFHQPDHRRHQAADQPRAHAGAARPIGRRLLRSARVICRLRSETELCLGLVHYTDGHRRDQAAARHGAQVCCTAFSIATECGFGRRKPETIPELLRIHAAAAEMD